MDTLSISREYSQQKLRIGKLAEKRGHAGIPPTSSGILLRPDPFSRTTYNRDKETPKKEGTPVGATTTSGSTPVKENSKTPKAIQPTSTPVTAPTKTTNPVVPQSAPGPSKKPTPATGSPGKAVKKEPIKRRNSLSTAVVAGSSAPKASSSVPKTNTTNATKKSASKKAADLIDLT
jgi:hypothetical protein